MADYNSSYTGAQIDEGVGAARAARAASGILKSNGSGTISAATPGTDYVSGNDYNPDAKTSAMTQAVGKDSNGKLWTTPGGGGGDSPYSVVNGAVCITYEEAQT